MNSIVEGPITFEEGSRRIVNYSEKIYTIMEGSATSRHHGRFVCKCRGELNIKNGKLNSITESAASVRFQMHHKESASSIMKWIRRMTQGTFKKIKQKNTFEAAREGNPH